MSTDPDAPSVDCQDVYERLSLYLDGEMDRDLTSEFARHLGDCPPCQDRADLEDCVKDLLRQRCADKAPPSLVARLQDVLSQAAE